MQNLLYHTTAFHRSSIQCICPIMAESNLQTLITSMEPVLNDGEYVYVTVEPEHKAIGPLLAQIAIDQKQDKRVVGFVAELEGLTFILRRSYADSLALTYDNGFIASWITLNVHSALDAVGFTAAVAAALTKAGISCNVVAAYYHDHLFVRVQDAGKAMEVLKELQQSAVKP